MKLWCTSKAVCYNKSMENNKKQQISTPAAILVAGVLIMVGILLTKSGNISPATKTLSEKVGVSKEKLNACIKATDVDALNVKINDSVDKAMSNIEQRGTPYSIVIGPNGFMTDIRGAESLANTQAIVGAAQEGKLATKTINGVKQDMGQLYKGNVPLPTSDEHILGNPDATVTIIEYSDFECPYCKQFHPVLKQIVQESNNTVRWVYRDYPLHQHSFEKLVAAECISKIKGNDAYWKYADLLFGLLKTANDSVSEQL